MKKTNDLKSTLKEAAEFYEHHSQQLTNRANKMTPGCNFRKDVERAALANKERAIAMREALEFVNEFIG